MPTRRTDDTARTADRELGDRLRLCRIELGLTQGELAAAVQVTFEQMLRYECGIDRVPPIILLRLSRFVGEPLSYFFGDTPSRPNERATMRVLTCGERSIQDEGPEAREVIELLRAFSRIKSENLRSRAIDLVRSVADNDRTLDV